jgi:hypothetical protein
VKKLERLVKLIYGGPKSCGRALASQLLSFLKSSMRGYQFTVRDRCFPLLKNSYFIAPGRRSTGRGNIEPVVSTYLCNQEYRLRTMEGIRAINAHDLMSAGVGEDCDDVDSVLIHNRIQELSGYQRNLIRVCLASFHLTLNRDLCFKRGDAQLESVGVEKKARTECLSAVRLCRRKSQTKRQKCG